MLNVGVTTSTMAQPPWLLSRGHSQPPVAPAKVEEGRAQPGHAGRPCRCQVGQLAPLPREATEPSVGASAVWVGVPGKWVAQECSCP